MQKPSGWLWPHGPFRSQEDVESFEEWKRTNADFVESLEKTPKESLLFLLTLTNFQYDRLSKAWHDALALLNTILETLPAIQKDAIKRGELAALLSERHKISAYEQQKEILAGGRRDGVAARQKTAKENREKLEKAIADLFDKPGKPGWRLTNEQIVEFLAPHFSYKRSTILQIVKREAAKHRKREKFLQASQLQNR